MILFHDFHIGLVSYHPAKYIAPEKLLHIPVLNIVDLHLKILTPEKSIFDEEVDKVVVPTDNGEIGILLNHTNLMTNLTPGSLRITQKGKETVMAIDRARKRLKAGKFVTEEEARKRLGF